MSRRSSVSAPRFVDPNNNLNNDDDNDGAASSVSGSLQATSTGGGGTLGASSSAYYNAGEPKNVRAIARIRPLLKEEAKKIPEYHPIPRPALITTSNDNDLDEDTKAAMQGTSLANAAAGIAVNAGTGTDLVIVMDPDKHFARKKGGAFAFRRVFPAVDLNEFERPPVKSLPPAGMGEVFAEIRPMIECTVNRVNSVAIVCGGAKSGKMTTMFGDVAGTDQEARGILPRYALEIFRAMASVKPPNSEYKFEVEFIEVVGDTITDLLLPASQRAQSFPVKIKDEGHSLVTLTHCTTVTVTDGPSMLSQIKLGLRAAARTKTPGTSSHLIFNFRVTEKLDFEHPDDSTQRVTKVTKYWAQFALVSGMPTAFVRCIDIAAQKSSGDKAAQQLKVPVRDSTVTRITSEAFGGNCETFCVVCVSPFYQHVKDSFNSLEAVAKFGRVRTRPAVSHDSQTSTFRRLHDEMSGLSTHIEKTNQAQEMVQSELDERQRRLEEAAAALEAQRTIQEQAEKRYGANEIVKIVKALRLLRLRRQGDMARKALEAELAEVDDQLKKSLSNVVHISQVNEELAEKIDELRAQEIEVERSKSLAEDRIAAIRSRSENPAEVRAALVRAHEAKMKALRDQRERDSATAKQWEAELVDAKKEHDAAQKELDDLEAPKKRLDAAKAKEKQLAKEKAELEKDIQLLEQQIAATEAKINKAGGCSCVVQ